MLKNLTLTRPLVVLDLETTGTRTDTDRIIEVSMLKVRPGGSASQHTLRINPGFPIPPEATAVHGITDFDVSGCLLFEEAVDQIDGYLEDCDLAGFNIVAFDLKILMAEFRRCDRPFSLVGRKVIDALTIYRKYEPRDLTSAVRHYLDREHDGAHGAEADVLATIAVLDAQVGRYAELPASVAELHDHLRDPASVDFEGKFKRRPDGVVVMAFSKHEGRPLAEMARLEPGFLRWMIAKDFLDDAKAIAREALETSGQPCAR